VPIPGVLGREEVSLGAVEWLGLWNALHCSLGYLSHLQLLRFVMDLRRTRMTMSCLFMERKHPSSLASLETVGEEDAVFVNERHDKIVVEGKRLTHATFFNLGLKDAQLVKNDFSFSTFVQCYFKGATISECKFTGCRFIDCNFRMADINNCDFTYADWRNTIITLSQVRTSIPERQNVAHSLLEALRHNSL
jgi:uncharacterized protein YjbI with pentapeptide repeats